MRTKMTIEYQGKKYIGWADDAVIEDNGLSATAWIYPAAEDKKDSEYTDQRVGYVEWPTVEGWENHKYDSETNKCTVEDCSGMCEDESNACTWLDEDATFHLTEYFDVTPEELIARLEEVK